MAEVNLNQLYKIVCEIQGIKDKSLYKNALKIRFDTTHGHSNEKLKKLEELTYSKGQVVIEFNEDEEVTSIIIRPNQ